MKKVAMTTIGCDLGDRQSELFLLRSSGKTQRPKPIATTLDGFCSFFEKRKKAHVVIEAGAHSRWVSALLEKLGHRVTVANPRRLRLISESTNKTDLNDAELLARMGRADVGLLHPVTHRGVEAHADLAVAKARDGLVRVRTRLVNTIRGVVKSTGHRLSKCTAESFVGKTKDEVPSELTSALLPLYAVLESIAGEIAKLDRKIDELAEKKYPDAQVVGQIPGVGNLTALVFVLTLEDPKRFKKSRSVGAFLGLTPRRDQSGEQDKQLQITKAGDEFLRRLLVQSANWILGPFGKDCDLRRAGERIAGTGKRKASPRARKIAKVAVARKLAVLMHSLWVTGEVYEPLRRLKAAAA